MSMARASRANPSALTILNSNGQSLPRRQQVNRRLSGPSQVDVPSRDRPSMFESASNIAVYGGNFAAQEGAQTTVTVNVNPGRAADDTNYHNEMSMREGENLRRSNSSTSGRLRNGSSNGRGRPPLSRGNHSEPGRVRPVQRSNVLYEQHLLHKGRGHPLWIPQPNMRLPIPYRSKGVCIGDVGIITVDGAFDFLFNICLPATDPIHSEDLPDGFVPIYPPLSRTDVREFREFTDGSYLASSSVAKVQSSHFETRALAFESSASDGAILTMPEGAYLEELNNVSKFRAYISVHAQNWYKFINGPRGREAKNGDLRLVVGCDKANSWGMATFSNVSQQNNFRLEFNARHDANGRPAPGNLYSWEHSGTAEVRVGPGTGENDELGATDLRPLRNQCLFVRTLSVTLADSAWEKLHTRRSVDIASNDSYTESTPSPSLGPLNLSSMKCSTSSVSSSKEDRGVKDTLLDSEKQPVNNHDVEVIVTYSSSPPRSIHPANLINDFLLKEVPHATMAVTNDRDWYPHSSIIPSLSDASDLLSRICRINHIRNLDGVVYLEPKEYESGHAPLLSEINSVIDGSSSVEKFLFGSSETTDTSRHRLLTELESALLKDYLVDDRISLADFILEQSEKISDPLEDLEARVYSGSLTITKRQPTNDGDDIVALAGHPPRLLSLQDIENLANTDRSSTGTISMETIPSLRNWLTSHTTNPRNESDINCLQNLAEALMRRFSLSMQREDLDEAIFYFNEALLLTASRDRDYSYLEILLGLCSAHYRRLQLSGRFEDVVALIKTLRRQNDLNLATILQPIKLRLNDLRHRDLITENEMVKLTDDKHSIRLSFESGLDREALADTAHMRQSFESLLERKALADTAWLQEAMHPGTREPKPAKKSVRKRLKKLAADTIKSTGRLRKRISKLCAPSLSRTSSLSSYHSPVTFAQESMDDLSAFSIPT